MGRSSQQTGAKSWGCGSVRWRDIFRYQTHGGWIVLIAAAVVAGLGNMAVKPEYRPLTVYDASVSLPNHPDTVSIELAGILPLIGLVVTVAAVEFGAMWKRQSLTMAIHAFFHIIWWAIIGFAVVLAITEATKPWASRYRPDYMSRCKPQVKAGAFTFAQRTDCDPAVKETDFVKDGRKSFPSGHSSNSMSLCWFTILYFVHALYWREGLRYMGSAVGGQGCGRRLLGEVLQALFIVWGLAVLSIAWCIGVTRFRDNRHNIDDILGGFVAALLYMTPCTIIALGQLNYYQQQLRKREEGEQLPLAQAHSSGASTSFSKEPTAAPAGVAPPVRSPASGNDHTAVGIPPAKSAASGSGYNAVHPAPADSAAAAAADADDIVRPAELHTLGEVRATPQGVVPVADSNGLGSSRY